MIHKWKNHTCHKRGIIAIDFIFNRFYFVLREVNFMKSNNLLQGFLIIFCAAAMVLAEEWITYDDTMPLEKVPSWTASDTISPKVAESFLKNDALDGEEVWDSSNEAKPIQKVNSTGLDRFYASLDRIKSRKGKTRIAYFGDSMIEGDLITQSLRNDLQELFGGQGVGFVPITSQTYGFRKTIRHRFSGDWKHYNFLTPNPTKHNFGISGELFLTSSPDTEAPGKTWVQYWGENTYPTTEEFNRIVLFYGRNTGGNTNDNYVTVTTPHGEETFNLDEDGVVNQLLISETPTDEVKFNFHIPSNLPVYGISFEDKNGVYVDNFSSRGNSGMNLIKIPSATLQAFDKNLKYDLVVLQFGLNVIMPGKTNYKFYERGMKRVVKHFQENMPNADILVVSVGDKSTSINGVRQTDPAVPLIVEAQRRVAEEMGTGFLNLYAGMGGRNSMVKWVNSDPALARKDYTHPNRLGAEAVANIVKEFLLKEYPAITWEGDELEGGMSWR